MDSTLLNKIEKHSTILLTENLSEKMVYHDIAYTHRMIAAINEICNEESVSDDDRNLLLATGWLLNLGFTHSDILNNVDGPEDLFSLCYQSSIMMSRDFLTKESLSKIEEQQIYALLEEAKPGNKIKTRLGKILSDAITIDWGKPKSKGKLKKLYEEFLLTGAVSYGKSTWYDSVLVYLREHEFYTGYGNRVLAPGKLELMNKIEK